MLPIRMAKSSKPAMMMRMSKMISHTYVLTCRVCVNELKHNRRESDCDNHLKRIHNVLIHPKPKLNTKRRAWYKTYHVLCKAIVIKKPGYIDDHTSSFRSQP